MWKEGASRCRREEGVVGGVTPLGCALQWSWDRPLSLSPAPFVAQGACSPHGVSGADGAGTQPHSSSIVACDIWTSLAT